ncbi:conserved hypothetical protein [Frankia canadensis]|uniref:V8-like Glu-specific endopeptidase n=1 Tax=Frankia canadensis TaxID=1836972 RepID=A0A2I2KLU1_9ACTN|nr:hypothetical protein [Frankia canadensis]SNQ46633.1 conserved hypothetical protein [Frankia canadensis]SOU53923.1 conserved hypothetical protein [Frankia canadensis]
MPAAGLAVSAAGAGTDAAAEVLDPAASAVTRGHPAPLSAPLSAPGAISAAEQQQVAQYWTAQRRDRAFGAHSAARLGAPAPARPPATRFADDPGSASTTTPPPPSDGTPYTRGGLVTATTGRLFTTIDGADFACSASVVTSAGRDLVVTAGHCLHGGAGSRFGQNVAFVPGYSDGTLPYGIWTARRLTITSAWAQGSNFDDDAGFALFNLQHGRHLQDVVGAQGIAFGLPITYPQFSFGYPRLAPYDGSHLIYCAGPGSADTYGGPSIGVTCRMTAGASGGPFITGLGRLGAGHGWIDGVVSYAYAGSGDRLYGTHFGAAVRLLYYQSAQL